MYKNIQKRVVFFAFFAAILSGVLLTTTHVSAFTALSGDAYHQRVRTELGNFVNWLSTNNARGYIGELGWPGNVSASEQNSWNLLGESWFRDADLANLWATPFFASRAQGTSDTLGFYVNSTGNPAIGSIDFTQGQNPVLQKHLETDLFKRGINIYGTTFGVNMDGTLDETQAVYPSQADLNYISSKGVKTIRLAVRWERIQRTLFGSLDSGELTKLNDSITAAANAVPTPLHVILVLGDNAQYWYTPNSSTPRTIYKMKTAGGTLNTEHLKDIWGKLSDLYKNNSTVIGYDLMNEPYNLDAETTSFSGTTINDWNDGTTQNWAGSGATFTNNTSTYYGATGGSLKVAKTGLAIDSYNNVFIGGSDISGLAATGNGFTCQIMLDPAQNGNWRALVGWQTGTPDFTTTYGSNFNLIPGEWVTVSHQFANTTNIHNMIIQVETAGGPNPDNLTFYVDQCGRGTVSTLTPAQVWETISQSMVSFFRNDKSDTKTILVPGYNYSSVFDWTTTHPSGWITDPAQNFLYEGHHYWDRDSSSSYTHTYAEEEANAVGRGYTTVGANPPIGQITLNNNAVQTINPQVSVSLSASDDVDTSSTIEYQVSPTTTFDTSTWNALTSSSSYTFNSDLGQKTLYARFRDAGGFTSGIYSDSINLVTPEQDHTSDSNSNNSSGNNSSSSNTSLPEDCHKTAPAGTPDLFQISPGKNFVKLYFSPVTENRDHYDVSFGTKIGAEDHSFSFTNNDSGVISVDVKALKPNTTYYFKVRAGNGCTVGNWSGVLPVKTGQKATVFKWKLIPKVVVKVISNKIRK